MRSSGTSMVVHYQFCSRRVLQRALLASRGHDRELGDLVPFAHARSALAALRLFVTE
jgi:hypothetical protein